MTEDPLASEPEDQQVEPEGSTAGEDVGAGVDAPAAPEAAEAQTPEPSAAPQRRRRAPSDRATNLVVIGLAILAVLAFSVLGYSTVTRRLDAARKADSATALIEKADVVVVQVDTVVRSEVTSSLAEPAKLAAANVPDATQQLEKAIQLLDEASAGTNLEDEKRTEQLMNAAKARLPGAPAMSPRTAFGVGTVFDAGR